MIHILNELNFFNDKHISEATLLENQGHSNESWIVVADGIKYLLKKLIRTDIDRDFEYKVQTLTFAQSLTAKPLFYNKQHGLTLCEFIEGTHKYTLNQEDILKLAQILEKLHAIKVENKPMDINIKNQTQELEESLETISNYDAEYVLCHNDLNPKNILWHEKVKLIDWEDAGINDRYFDLASVCVEFELNDEMQDLFLKSYFEDKPFILDKLKAYKMIYKAIYKEWFANSKQ